MFLASNEDVVRIRNIEAGLQLCPQVVELTVAEIADTNPDILREPAAVNEDRALLPGGPGRGFVLDRRATRIIDITERGERVITE